MELWTRIDAQREERKRRIWLARRRQAVLGAALLIGAGLSSLWWPPREENIPELCSFPIELAPAVEAPAIASAVSPADILPVTHRSTVAPVARLIPAATVEAASSAPTEPANQTHLPATIDPMPEAAPSDLDNLALLPAVDLQIGRKNKYSEDIKCADFDPGQKGRFAFEVLASPDWSFRRLEPREREYAGYVEDRNRTESPDFNYSIGLRMSYAHPSGIVGRIGFNYSQINEKFEYQTENEEVITIRNVYGPGGDVIGTDTLVETNIRRSYTNNRFESYDIPVIVGYQKNFKKLSLSAQAGVLLNIDFRSKGDFLSPMDGEPVSFDEGKADSYPAFRDRLGVGIYAGLSLAYPVAPQIQLFVEPHLRSYPKTVTRDQYMVTQKYLLTGLSVGVRRYL